VRYIFDRLCEPRYYDKQKAGSSIEEFKSLIVKELYRISAGARILMVHYMVL